MIVLLDGNFISYVKDRNKQVGDFVEFSQFDKYGKLKSNLRLIIAILQF